MNAAAAGRTGWRARIGRWLSPGPGLEWATDERICARCHYDFPGGTRGQARPCIECGAALDPAMPGTLIAPGPSEAARWLMHAPGLWYQLAVLAGCALVFVGDMAPGGWFGTLLLGTLWLLLAGAYGIVRAVTATALAIRWKRLRQVDGQPGWWLPPSLVALMFVLVALGLPMQLGFRLQHPRLEAARVAWEALPPEQRAKGPSAPVSLWTPFGLRAASMHGEFAAMGRYDPSSGMAIEVPATGFLDTGAYFYLPAMLPENARAAGFRPLGDGWYAGTFDGMD